jgi:hypothetical protein
MGVTFPIILAAKLLGSVLTVADDFPKFNPEPGCRAASAQPVDGSCGIAGLQSLYGG